MPPGKPPAAKSGGVEGYSPSTLFARFTRSLVENPVAASRNFLNLLFVSIMTSSLAAVSDSVFTRRVFPPAPGVASSFFRAPNRTRYEFAIFSGSTSKQFPEFSDNSLIEIFCQASFDGVLLHTIFLGSACMLT